MKKILLLAVILMIGLATLSAEIRPGDLRVDVKFTDEVIRMKGVTAEGLEFEGKCRTPEVHQGIRMPWYHNGRYVGSADVERVSENVIHVKFYDFNGNLVGSGYYRKVS